MTKLTKQVAADALAQSGDCCGHKARREANVDEALTQSFPASDPPAFAQPAPEHAARAKSCRCGDTS